MAGGTRLERAASSFARSAAKRRARLARAVREHAAAVLEVAARRHAVGPAEDGAGLGAEHRVDLLRGEDVVDALLALAVGVLAGVEAAVGSAHLAAQVRRGLAHRPEQVLVAGAAAAPGLGVDAQQLPLVVEHLLEVRHRPARVDAVAVEAAAQLVVDAAARHLAAGEDHVIERLARLALGQRVAPPPAAARDSRGSETWAPSRSRRARNPHPGAGAARPAPPSAPPARSPRGRRRARRAPPGCAPRSASPRRGARGRPAPRRPGSGGTRAGRGAARAGNRCRRRRECRRAYRRP